MTDTLKTADIGMEKKTTMVVCIPTSRHFDDIYFHKLAV